MMKPEYGLSNSGPRPRSTTHPRGGGRGIRTPEPLSGLTVFKTAGFNRSPIPPVSLFNNLPCPLFPFNPYCGDCCGDPDVSGIVPYCSTDFQIRNTATLRAPLGERVKGSPVKAATLSAVRRSGRATPAMENSYYTCPDPVPIGPGKRRARARRTRDTGTSSERAIFRSDIPCLRSEADEIDAQCPEFFQTIHKVLKRPCEAVEFPNQHDVEHPLRGIMHQVVERGPATLSPADTLVDVFVCPAEALAGVPAEVSQLQVAVLVQSTDASIKRNRLCAFYFHVRPYSARCPGSMGRHLLDQSGAPQRPVTLCLLARPGMLAVSYLRDKFPRSIHLLWACSEFFLHRNTSGLPWQRSHRRASFMTWTRFQALGIRHRERPIGSSCDGLQKLPYLICARQRERSR